MTDHIRSVGAVLLNGSAPEKIAAAARLSPPAFSEVRKPLADALEVPVAVLDGLVATAKSLLPVPDEYDDVAQRDPPEPFFVVAVSEILVESQPETVQGIFGPKSVGVMAGVPNAGKTFLGIDLAIHIAANQSWFGRKVRGGPVLYVGAEAPGSVKLRASVAAEQKFPGYKLPLYIATATPLLGNTIDNLRESLRLLATVQKIQTLEGAMVKLIVIDTLASVLGGGEENGEGMLLVAQCAKFLAASTEAAVLLIHHPNKSDASSLRGHSSLAAAVDTIISITSDDTTGIRTATLTKSRDSPAGIQVHFELLTITLAEPDCFGDPKTTCIVRAAGLSQIPKRRPSGKSQEQLLIELERRYRCGETSWDRAAVTMAAKGIGLHRNSAPVALNGLVKAGFVIGSDDRLRLKNPPDDCT